MKIAIAQLSDIHISSENDHILSRTNKITEVLNKYASHVERIFILLTGDIAYSGKKEEYDLAKTFINTIRDNSDYKTPISIVMAPGNHDCNFDNNTSVRDVIISSLQSDSNVKVDQAIIKQCVCVQKEYFDFRDEVAGDGILDGDELWTQYEFKVGDHLIIFDCLNIAWFSTKKESIGKLLFPYDNYPILHSKKSDIRFVALHHPVHWLKQDQYRDLRTRVRTFGDLVFTGHEHDESASIIDDEKNGQSILIEAGALQESGKPKVSKFNVIEVDLQEKEFKYNKYSLEGEEYNLSSSSRNWKSFKPLPQRQRSDFKISDAMCEWLNDPGANYAHPNKDDVKLNDIFVYPDFEDINSENNEKYLVSAEILQNADLLTSGTVVSGQEKSGKTALLRTLFIEYYEQGYTPIYVDMKEISHATEKELHAIFTKAAKFEYADDSSEQWERLPKEKKILLLDDLDRTKIAEKFRWKIISFAKKQFNAMIITTSDLFEANELSSQDMLNAVKEFNNYEIQSFGHKLRYNLIKKWGEIGTQYSLSSNDHIPKTDSTEKILNAVLGTNLVPRVPIYLLILLQSIESTDATDIKNGTFGHYYQFLITCALSKVKVNPGELDEFFNYFSQLSWLFYNSGGKELHLLEIEKFTDIYSSEYSRINCKERLNLLVKARLIDNRGEYYSFSYPYIYYYFLGKYISERIHNDQEIQKIVRDCADKTYKRSNANILLFSLHHQKNDFIIDCLLDEVRKLFSEFEEVQFDNDTGVFNELIEGTARLVYKDSDPNENRLKQREQQDLHEGKVGNGNASKDGNTVDLSLISSLNKLFKTVDILGQLLKSYYGSIKNDRKKEIIQEIYSAPLRSLRQFFVLLEENQESLINDIEKQISQKSSELGRDKRRDIARKFVFNIFGFVSFGFVSKSASATSSIHLKEVVKMVIDEGDNLAYKLTSLASKLDMPGDLPYDEIKSLSDDTEKNIFAHRLLESIVLKHLYLFKVSFQDKQRMCEILGITMERQRNIDMKTKRSKLIPS